MGVIGQSDEAIESKWTLGPRAPSRAFLVGLGEDPGGLAVRE